jgi:hypothetical protein
VSAQRTSKTDRHGTPRAVVDLVRATLGRIDLDPFSDPEWNAVIGADRILTKRDDAYRVSWFAESPTARDIIADDLTVWNGPRCSTSTAIVNPPGDKTGRKVRDAWTLTEWHHRNSFLGGGAVWIAFSTHHLQTTQQSPAPRSLMHPDFVLLVPSRRLAYQCAPGVSCKQPPHPSAIVLLPAHDKAEADRQCAIFRLVGGRMGDVR